MSMLTIWSNLKDVWLMYDLYKRFLQPSPSLKTIIFFEYIYGFTLSPAPMIHIFLFLVDIY